MNSVLSGLMTLDRAGLVQRWEEVFGIPAPALSRKGLLRQSIGWQLQAATHGKLSGSERRQLKDGAGSNSSPRLAVGSRLIRVWQGETHQVTVLEEGFLYGGKQWRSLTAISRAITGTAWSGPVFFGIRK